MPPSAIWIAHPRLPLPAYVELTRIDTGRTIIARAATRPASSNATAPVELSQGAARLLGLAPDGQAAFRVRRLTPSLQERTALRLGQPGAARLDTPESLLVILRRKAAQLPSARVPDNHPQKNEAGMIRLQPATPLAKGDLGGRETPSKVVAASRWYIQITAVSRAEKAHDLARQLAGSVSATGGLFRVRTGPYPSLDAARAALGPIRARGYPDARLTR